MLMESQGRAVTDDDDNYSSAGHHNNLLTVRGWKGVGWTVIVLLLHHSGLTLLCKQYFLALVMLALSWLDIVPSQSC